MYFPIPVAEVGATPSDILSVDGYFDTFQNFTSPTRSPHLSKVPNPLINYENRGF